MEVGDALALLEQATEIMSKERNIVHIEAPVMVVGDVHGQYFDLLNILDQWQQADSNILFLGDYVDRGAFSCEVILHLLALKVQYPKQVFLLRGNHECSTVCSHFGFKEECKVCYLLSILQRSNDSQLTSLHAVSFFVPSQSMVSQSSIASYLASKLCP
jgi:serine/threonine-protein phosphatase 2B catalytic subunit